MTINNNFRAEMRSLESHLLDVQDNCDETHKKETRHKSATEHHWGQMNFRERHLRGWFGGKTEHLIEYKKEKELTETFNVSAAQLDKEVYDIDSTINHLIKEKLDEGDMAFQELKKTHDATKNIKSSLTSFLKVINRALSEIDDAQDMETLDLFSNNSGISMMSYFENDEAKEAIKDVKKAAPKFQKSLEDYSKRIEDIDMSVVSDDISDGWDLAFDFCGDGFDFMSIFTLSALDDAEDGMRELRGKVNDIDGIISEHLSKAEKNVKSYIYQARADCQLSDNMKKSKFNI